MLASRGKAIFIQLFWVVTAQAGPLEQLSKGAFLVTGNRCQSYNEKSAQIGVRSLCINGKSPENTLRDLLQFVDDGAEDQLFVHLAKQQVTELNCAEDFARALASPTVEPKRLAGIQAKLDLARFLKQRLAKASQKLATDPDVTTRSCPLNIDAIEAETPQEQKGEKAYLICKEIITSRELYFSTVSLIPISGVSDVGNYIEKYVNAAEEPTQNGELQNAYQKSIKTLQEGAKKLSTSLNEKGVEALGRRDRYTLLQDPALAEKVISQIPLDRQQDVRGLLCQADARYGKGSDSLDGGLMVVSLAFSGGVGVWARSGSAVSKMTQLALQGRAAGQVTKSAVKTIGALKTIAVGADMAAGVIAVNSACQDRIIPELKTSDACMSAPSVEKADHENCVLISALSATGFAALIPEGTLSALGNRISDQVAIAKSGIKSVSKAQDPQSLIWAAKARGDVAEANRLEKQLLETLQNQKIVDSRPIGKGASRPYYVRFEDGTEGVWKKSTGWPADGPAETAAFKWDQEVGADMIGATVPRSFNGVPGTVQVRVTNLKKMSKEDNPDELSLFDYVLGNRDRHYNNYLQNQSGQLVAIDHGMAFNAVSTNNGLLFFNNKVDSLKTRITKRVELEKSLEQVKAATNSAAEAEDIKKQITKLKLQESQLQSAIVAAMPDKKVIDKLRQTKLARWREVLGGDLSDKQIKALYKRQQELLRSIDRAVKEIGPQLLYREGPVSPLMSTPPASGYPLGNIQIFGRPKQ
jgi:hypothetical protein